MTPLDILIVIVYIAAAINMYVMFFVVNPHRIDGVSDFFGGVAIFSSIYFVVRILMWLAESINWTEPIFN